MSTKIDWPFQPFDVWNPVIGCKGGCTYCYARAFNKRFHYIPVWENPVFFWDRFDKLFKRKTPTTYFVGSMCDLFGDWIPDDWIKQVIKACDMYKPHTFMFLTKNPVRYLEFDFPDNVWLGCTIPNDNPDKTDSDIAVFDKLYWKYKTFVSIEPILSGFQFGGYLFNHFDLVIIGAMTGRNPVIPKKEWIDSIQHPNIYYKSNIRKHFPDLKNKEKY